MDKTVLKTKKHISDSLEKAFNIQAQRELDSSMIYMSMHEYFKYNGLQNLAKLYEKYADEEFAHYKKFKGYLQDRNVLPETPASTKQPTEYDGIKDILQKTYDHEVQVSTWIEDLAKQCLKEGDLSSYQFLNWFINEQIEEIDKAIYWIDKVIMYERYNKPLGDLDEAVGEYLD